MQFQEKRMIQTQENGENFYFRSDLVLLGPNSGCEMFSSQNNT